MSADIYFLKGAVQQYAWGKLGITSKVAELLSACDPTYVVESNTPYAELWMGTHPKGLAKLVDSDEEKPLSEFIQENPDCLGPAIQNAYGDSLPFLFKVLSVRKALSIQAHPNKSHAEELHAEFPDIYPDPNHKPEMAIALTDFEVLCAFRPFHEISGFLTSVPELREIVGEELATEFQTAVESNMDTDAKDLLSKCFERVMKLPKDVITTSLKELIQRLKGECSHSEACVLIMRLHKQFPGDVGCFVVYFLNYIKLLPGEAIFLRANLPHAYLHGDCIECMANSDNVVRAGLTPKYIDVNTLCSMLDYEPIPPDLVRFSPKPSPIQNDTFQSVFMPDVPDFAVSKFVIPTDAKRFRLLESYLKSASILLVVSGKADAEYGLSKHKFSLSKGSIIFAPAGAHIRIREVHTELLIFRAFCSAADGLSKQSDE